MSICTLAASFCCLILAIVLYFVVLNLNNNDKIKKVKPVYVLAAGAFLSLWIVMLAVDNRSQVHGEGTRYFLATMHSIQAMLLGFEFNILYDSIKIGTAYSSAAYIYISILLLIAPAVTVTFVLSFFESAGTFFKYIIGFGKDIYVISDLSDKTVALAKSIREKYPKAMIVITNTSDSSSPTKYELTAEAKKQHALLYKKEISDMSFKFHKKAVKLSFFTLNDNESVNIDWALKLIKKFKLRDNTELYALSTSKTGETMLDSADFGLMKVRRINKDKAFAYELIRKYPIIDDVTVKDGKKIISTLIIGFGGYGTELTKAILWCGQLPGYDLEINVIDKLSCAKSVFEAQCPEIMKLNNSDIDGEAKYRLNFFEAVDIYSHNFKNILSSLSDTSSVYISLGNDDLNIETAIETRIAFKRIGINPKIRTIVYSDVKSEGLKSQNLLNYKEQSYDIEFIGNIGERFSYDAIVKEELEKAALECHLKWCKTAEDKENSIKLFAKYEYYRNSSMSSAIHDIYRKRANYDVDTGAIAEHMRWCAFMRTEGYIYSGSTEESSKCDIAKMHNDLVPFSMLKKSEAQKDYDLIN